MKKFTFIIIIFILALTACNKKESEITPVLQKNIIDQTWLRYPIDTIPCDYGINNIFKTSTYPLTSFVSIPDVNIYLSSPTSSVTYNNITYYGGPFNFCVTTINGSTITFKLQRTDGSKFPIGSSLSIKYGNAGGTLINGCSLAVASTTCNLNITDTKTWNISGGGISNSNNTDNYIATWYNPTSGLTFYTQPIMLVAVPTGWGASLGSLNNVSVYSNGWGGFSST